MEHKEWYQHQAPGRQPNERRPYPQPYGQPYEPRPRVQENSLKEILIQIERKSFMLALKENVRGRFLRLTEGANGRMTTVIIPASGLKEFQKAINELVKAHDALPPASELPPNPSGLEVATIKINRADAIVIGGGKSGKIRRQIGVNIVCGVASAAAHIARRQIPRRPDRLAKVVAVINGLD